MTLFPKDIQKSYCYWQITRQIRSSKTISHYLPMRLWHDPQTGMESNATDKVEYEIVGTPDMIACVTYSP